MDLPLDVRVALRLTDERGFYATKTFPNGEWAALNPLTFGRARITKSKAGDEYGYYEGW